MNKLFGLLLVCIGLGVSIAGEKSDVKSPKLGMYTEVAVNELGKPSLIMKVGEWVSFQWTNLSGEVSITCLRGRVVEVGHASFKGEGRFTREEALRMSSLNLEKDYDFKGQEWSVSKDNRCEYIADRTKSVVVTNDLIRKSSSVFAYEVWQGINQ